MEPSKQEITYAGEPKPTEIINPLDITKPYEEAFRIYEGNIMFGIMLEFRKLRLMMQTTVIPEEMRLQIFKEINALVDILGL